MAVMADGRVPIQKHEIDPESRHCIHCLHAQQNIESNPSGTICVTRWVEAAAVPRPTRSSVFADLTQIGDRMKKIREEEDETLRGRPPEEETLF